MKSKKPKTQNDLILEHLKTHGPLNPIQALNCFRCFRLAARIAELRAAGHQIETEIMESGDARFARYRLVS